MRYVEKLINIELNVPKASDDELKQLLRAAQLRQLTPANRRTQAAVRWGRRQAAQLSFAAGHDARFSGSHPPANA